MRTTHDFATDDGRSCSGGHCAGLRTAGTSAAPPTTCSRRCWAKTVSPWCLLSSILYGTEQLRSSCSPSSKLRARYHTRLARGLMHCNRTKQCSVVEFTCSLSTSPLFKEKSHLRPSPLLSSPPRPPLCLYLNSCSVRRRIVNAN